MRDKILVTTTAVALVLLMIAVGLLFAIWERAARPAAPMVAAVPPSIVIVDQSRHEGCCWPPERGAHASKAPSAKAAPAASAAASSSATQPTLREIPVPIPDPVAEAPLPLPRVLDVSIAHDDPRIFIPQGSRGAAPSVTWHRASSGPEKRAGTPQAHVSVSVPEPPMAALLASGLVILFLASRRSLAVSNSKSRAV